MRLLSYMTPGFPVSLFEALAAVIDVELDLEQELSGPAKGEDPFRDGTADLGWICSTSFVDLSTRGPDPSIRLGGVAWVPDDPGSQGRPVYFGDLVVPDGSPVTRLADLAGKRIGCNDHVSLSGHHALRFEMANQGFDPNSFADLVFTGGHRRSLDMVAAGELDACVSDSVVRISRAGADPAIAALRVIARLGPWPVQPLVVRSTMPESEARRVQAALLGANDDPLIMSELRAASLTKLVPVGADHYQVVRKVLSTF